MSRVRPFPARPCTLPEWLMKHQLNLPTDPRESLHVLTGEFIPVLATRASEFARLASSLSAQRDAGAFGPAAHLKTPDRCAKIELQSAAHATGGAGSAGESEARLSHVLRLAPSTPHLASVEAPAPLSTDAQSFFPLSSAPGSPALFPGAPGAGATGTWPTGHRPSALNPQTCVTSCYKCGTRKTVKWRRIETSDGTFW